MESIKNINRFKGYQNLILEGYDPVSAAGFTQVPNLLLRDKTLSANAKTAYAILLSYAWHNDRVFPGQERMSADLGVSQPTIARSIKELQSAGWLEVIRRGQGKTNIYCLKIRIAAKHEKRSSYSPVNNKKYTPAYPVMHP